MSSDIFVDEHRWIVPVINRLTDRKILASTGLQISRGRISGPSAIIRHYALCQKNEPMTTQTARRLGKLIQLLRHPAGVLEIRTGHQGIYHLLFHLHR